jgi:hypothetical protein
VNTVMNLPVPQNVGNFLTKWNPVSFSRRPLLRGVNVRACLRSLDRFIHSWMVVLWETSTLNMEATGFCETLIHTHNTASHPQGSKSHSFSVDYPISVDPSYCLWVVLQTLVMTPWTGRRLFPGPLYPQNGILTDEPNVERYKIVHILTLWPMWSCVCGCVPQCISSKSLPTSVNDNTSISSWSNWNVAIARSIRRCLQEEPETPPLILPASDCSFPVRPFDQPPEELSCTLTPSGCISLYIPNFLPQWLNRYIRYLSSVCEL